MNDDQRLVEVGDRVIFLPETHHIRRLKPGTDHIVTVARYTDEEWSEGKFHKIPRYVRSVVVINDSGLEADYTAKHFVPCRPDVTFGARTSVSTVKEKEAAEASTFHMALSEL